MPVDYRAKDAHLLSEALAFLLLLVALALPGGELLAEEALVMALCVSRDVGAPRSFVGIAVKASVVGGGEVARLAAQVLAELPVGVDSSAPHIYIYKCTSVSALWPRRRESTRDAIYIQR